MIFLENAEELLDSTAYSSSVRNSYRPYELWFNQKKGNEGWRFSIRKRILEVRLNILWPYTHVYTYLFFNPVQAQGRYYGAVCTGYNRLINCSVLLPCFQIWISWYLLNIHEIKNKDVGKKITQELWILALDEQYVIYSGEWQKFYRFNKIDIKINILAGATAH